MRLGWERPRSLALWWVLTNRMREYFTYGSVGGAGGNPGSYPAANGDEPFRPGSIATSVAAHPRRSPRTLGAVPLAMPELKTKCVKCGVEILQATTARTGGL